jgi:peptidoglycan/LPS O-acetylase OafA/YrhL
VRAPTVPRRPDIEGLRGIAVLLVLVFDAQVPPLTGGFVGVDVFFVISGYVITGLLLATMAGGRISLAEFYARRARRILPSAGVVLVATLALGWLVLPPLRLQDTTRDALAATFWLGNWRFVDLQTDYFTTGLEASPVLHYWSLGVEEQFYLAWPSLFVLLAGAHRRARSPERSPLTWALAGLTALSLTLNLWFTTVSAPLAYLGSPTRAWQFGLGGLAAVLLPSSRPATAAGRRSATASWRTQQAAPRSRRELRTATPVVRDPLPPAAGWLGLGAIAVSTVTFDATTSYPGAAALLPTLGTVAVLVGGAGYRTAAALLSHPALRGIGHLSYPWYLWHWPLVVLAEAALGPLSWPLRLLVVLASAGPAWVTSRLVEQPIRSSRVLSRRPALGLQVGLLAVMVPVIGISLTMVGTTRALAHDAVLLAAAPATAADPFGAARTPGHGSVRPAPAQARADLPDYPPECEVSVAALTSPPCRVGTVGAHVVLIGDSHAAQWVSVVEAIAAEHGWSTELLLKGGCPLPAVSVSPTQLGRRFTECDTWRENTLRRLASEPRPTMIFAASLNHYPASAAQVSAGWKRVATRLAAVGVPVVYLVDTPYLRDDVPVCLSGALSHWADCARPRTEVISPDPVTALIRSGAVHGITPVDVNPLLCPASGSTCPAVLGSTLLYRDGSHLTDTATRRLQPAVENSLRRQGVLH